MSSPSLPSRDTATPFSLPDPARKAIFLAAAALCLTPWITAPYALLMGLIIAQVTGNPFAPFFKDHKIIGRLLQYSVVGLGFGMSIDSVVDAGQKGGIVLTIVSIFGTLIIGMLAGLALGIDRKTTHLISSGTAICGGSAIAAVSPVIHADEKQITVALGIVFILNSIALFVFPPLGKYFGMNGHQFGLWSAIAIHDTSSVVGAAVAFGDDAEKTATPVKLFRALWIIPLALGTSFFFKGEQKIKIPYFIGFFILAILINDYLTSHIPQVSSIFPSIVKIAKKGLVLTLFFIGASLSLKTIRSVGFRPLLLGILLWLVIGGASLTYVLHWVTK